MFPMWTVVGGSLRLVVSCPFASLQLPVRIGCLACSWRKLIDAGSCDLMFDLGCGFFVRHRSVSP